MSHQFSSNLLTWYDEHGRKDLPWQHPRNAYRVWVSEIMLQQTQVKTVLPYFERFIQRFSSVSALAQANEEEVLALWSGLGYYSRARHLHKTARIIHNDFLGIFPSDPEQLMTLPGIGPSTAAAIASLAYDKAAAILDGNVKRVLSRYFMIDGPPNHSATQKTLWQLAKQCMPAVRCADYSQAIMDLGATCCTPKNPLCPACPLQKTCLSKQNNKVDEYPNKNAKKKLPTKQQQFILLHTLENSIYLEKRPSKGLWGGLWCLPIIDIAECPNRFIEHTYALEATSPHALMNLKHSFSHFNLHIHALSMQVLTNQLETTTLSGRWITAHSLKQYGLPKPVSTIINHFLKQSPFSVDHSEQGRLDYQY